MSELDKFDHPCKDTCSGWEQGFEKGQKSRDEALKVAVESLEKAKIHSECYEELMLILDEALAKLRELGVTC